MTRAEHATEAVRLTELAVGLIAAPLEESETGDLRPADRATLLLRAALIHSTLATVSADVERRMVRGTEVRA